MLKKPKRVMHYNTLKHTLQHTATHCNTLQHTATHCNTQERWEMEDVLAKLSRVTHCNIPQRSASKCNTLQHIAKRCNIMQHIATPCNTQERRELGDVVAKLSRVTLDNTLQNTATNCNTTATHRNTLQHLGASGDGKCASETEQSERLQHTATHCNKLQHTATPRSVGRWRMCWQN